MAYPHYRDANLTDRRLRRKDDLVDDPDTLTDQYDPGTIFAVVGGVAQAGNLTAQFTPLDTAKFPTPDPVVFAVTTETLAQGAAALYAAFNTALGATAGVPNNRHLGRYIERVEYTAAGTGVRIVPNPFAPPFLPTMSGAGTMTLTFTPDDTFPITGVAAKQVGKNVGPPGAVVLSVHSVTAADDVNGIGSCTFDLEVLRVVERFDPVTSQQLRPGVRSLGTLTGVTLGEEITVPLGGGRFGVRVTNIANQPSGHDAFDVRWDDVVT